MLKNKSRGFTLIELLTVIAIIGILAGTILVNMNRARKQAQAAEMKVQMNDLRTAMELYYIDHKSYGTVDYCGPIPCGGCNTTAPSVFSTPQVKEIIDNIIENTLGGVAREVVCTARDQNYTVIAKMPTAGYTDNYNATRGGWCVGNKGVKEVPWNFNHDHVADGTCANSVP